MRTRSKERLKDIIIDHIYSHCYDQVARTLDGENPAGTHPGDDPELQKIYDTFVNSSGEIRIYNDLRRATHCRVIVDKAIQPAIAGKLAAEGYKNGNRLTKRVDDALTYLVNRSYLIKKYPANSEYTLTPKGIEHYSSGRSFEQSHNVQRATFVAVTVSIISVVAAAAAIAMNLDLFR